MNKILKQLTIFVVILGVVAFFGFNAHAESQAGSDFLRDFRRALEGSVGTTAGLVISLVGLYMWIWNQVSWGLIVALGGALITAFPGIYNAVGEFGTQAFKDSATLNPTPVNGSAAAGANNVSSAK